MTTKQTEAPHVYSAIAAVQGALSKLGIAKHKAASGGVNYAFRGIDAVYGALSPLLAEHGLIIIPRVLNRDVVERQSKNGGALFYVALQVEFDFVSALDGTKHTACTYGEAMDSSDKATNKAMSAAYKYAAFMTFAIPTEGDNDADATQHEVAPAMIDDGQRDELIAMIEGYGFNVQKICEFYKIASLKEIPAEEFVNVKAYLNRQFDKKKAKEAE